MLKTDPYLLTLFSVCKSMEQVKQIHLQTITRGFSLHPYVYSKLITYYCSTKQHPAGSVDNARKLFDVIPEPNVFLWNTMIKGYIHTSRIQNAVSMYVKMLRSNVKPDCYTFPFLLKGFTQRVELVNGKGIHCHLFKFGFGPNVAAEISLIHMYSLCGSLEASRKVFDTSLKMDVVTWNIMIAGYNRRKLFDESRKLFLEMEERRVEPTFVTLVSMLSVCSKLKDVDGTKHVHGLVKESKVEPNLVVNNALIDAYAACGEMDAALAVFEGMKSRDVISWTALISGFVNVGKVDIAREFFDQMLDRDLVSWTVMIDGYVKQNRFKEGLMLFKNMQDAKVEPDEFTVVTILTACANTGALELGEWVKVCIDKNKIKIKKDIVVGNALIDMYFKCGEVGKAVDVFEKIPARDKFTWTTMIVGYAMNGFGNEAINMFNLMLNASIKPDHVCYLGVLSACTHTGMVDEGRKFFASMTIHHEIEPEVEHYGCMVDLLGRAGLLAEAYDLINSMRIRPNSVVWRALLGACGIHKDADLAEIAAKKLVELEPENGGVYVLLCNIYAACNRWEDLRELRSLMMIRGVTKTPGCSSIEIYGNIHEFVARDRSHIRSDEIYGMVEMITEDLRVSGYAPQTSEIFLNIEE
uniref:putative pentatricopeptide repeat-containing protein At3g15930 n=1 Tax=Erigeron canadensis TaxID=72917 RepID=UPI001CB8D405|nr:putative pentatricopeptide repeat-containing protein At3g15930 [Erigeron canadensis]XP_043626913.1 putative pentatricopeptide repeat-containing protein At3g15930 [Erigeron canadensis]